jgi:hypothetical protein
MINAFSVNCKLIVLIWVIIFFNGISCRFSLQSVIPLCYHPFMRNAKSKQQQWNISREHIKSLTKAQRVAIADAVGTTEQYLYQIGKGERTPSRKLLYAIQKETKGRVRAEDFVNEFQMGPM